MLAEEHIFPLHSGRKKSAPPEVPENIIPALFLFQLNMVITSIIILCAIAMAFYKLIQSMEHYYRKKY